MLIVLAAYEVVVTLIARSPGVQAAIAGADGGAAVGTPPEAPGDEPLAR